MLLKLVSEDWLQRLTPEGRKRMITDSELVLISNFIGSNWQELGKHMGFLPAKMQQLQMQYSYR